MRAPSWYWSSDGDLIAILAVNAILVFVAIAVAGRGRRRQGPASPASLLQVFWPAFLGWGSAVLVFAIFKTHWYANATGRAGRATLILTWLAVSVLAVLGAIYVTVRHRAARHWIAVPLNFSTAFFVWWILAPRAVT